MIIQKKHEDVCDTCFVCTNQHKYGKLPKRTAGFAFHDSDTDGDSDAYADSDEEDDRPPALSTMTAGEHARMMREQKCQRENEQMGLDAAKHVGMAMRQRAYFNLKKEQAKADVANNVPKVRSRLCLVADFAPKMKMPNFASEQPDAAYYYSPMSMYPFGIVDGGTSPSLLSAHVFYEGQVKKGGNSVASMLWKDAKLKRLLEGEPAEELTYVFDNCGGRNNNKMVLRWIALMVNLHVARTVRAVFLVRGHTKNDCDRCFNLMKCNYRITNVYTPRDLIRCINDHDQVSALLMDLFEFYDWNSFENQFMILEIAGCKTQHVFTVKDTEPHVMLIQEHVGSEEVDRKFVIKLEFRDMGREWGLEQIDKTLQVVELEGMPVTKWCELYSKWGKYVPRDKKKEFKYYHEKPSKETIDGAKKSSKNSKATRKEHGRTTATTTESTLKN